MAELKLRYLVGIGALAAALLLGALAGTAISRAYNDYDNPPCTRPYSGGGSYLSVWWRNHNNFPPTGDYNSAFISARSSWNGTATPVWFTHSPSTVETHGVQSFGQNGALGHVDGMCIMGSWTTIVWLNSYYLDNMSYSWKQKVAAHELGHQIRLGHSYYYAVMRPDGNVAPVSPTSDDVCGVNTRYPSTSWPAGWWCF